MRKKGRVVEVNQVRGMFIISIENGDYAVFELLCSVDISKGDRLEGNLDALGSEVLQHLDQKCAIEVYGQSGPSSLNACQRLLR